MSTRRDGLRRRESSIVGGDFEAVVWREIVDVSFVVPSLPSSNSTAKSFITAIGDKQAKLKQVFQLNRLKVETKQLSNCAKRALSLRQQASFAASLARNGWPTAQQAATASNNRNKEAQFWDQSVSVGFQAATILRRQARCGVERAGAEPAALRVKVKVRAAAVTGGGAGVKSWRASREISGVGGRPQPQQVVTTSNGARRQRELGTFGLPLTFAGRHWKPGQASRATRASRGGCRLALAAKLELRQPRVGSSLQSITTTTTRTTTRATSGNKPREDYFVSNTWPRLRRVLLGRSQVAGRRGLTATTSGRAPSVGETVFLNRACRGASLAKSGPLVVGLWPRQPSEPPPSLPIAYTDRDHCCAPANTDIRPLGPPQAAALEDQHNHRRGQSASLKRAQERTPVAWATLAKAPRRREPHPFFPPEAGHAFRTGRTLESTNIINMVQQQQLRPQAPSLTSSSTAKMTTTTKAQRPPSSSFSDGRQRPAPAPDFVASPAPSSSAATVRLGQLGPSLMHHHRQLHQHHKRPLLGENGILTERTRRLDVPTSPNKPLTPPLLPPPPPPQAPSRRPLESCNSANKDREEETNNLHPLEVIDQRRRLQISIYDPLPRPQTPMTSGARCRRSLSPNDTNNNELNDDKLQSRKDLKEEKSLDDEEEERLRELFPLELRRPILDGSVPVPLPPTLRPQISEITIELEDEGNVSKSLQLNCEWPRAKLVDRIRSALGSLAANRRLPRQNLDAEAERLLDVCIEAAAREAAAILRQRDDMGELREEPTADPTAMSSADQARWCSGVTGDADDATAEQGNNMADSKLANICTSTVAASQLREPDGGGGVDGETNDRGGIGSGKLTGFLETSGCVWRGGATFASVAAATKRALEANTTRTPPVPRPTGAAIRSPTCARRSPRQQQSARFGRQDHRAVQRRRTLLATMEQRDVTKRSEQQQQQHVHRLTGESDNKRQVSSGQPDSTMDSNDGHHQGSKYQLAATGGVPLPSPPSYARTVRAANCTGALAQLPEATRCSPATTNEDDCSLARRPPSAKGISPGAQVTSPPQSVQQQRLKQAAKVNDAGGHHHRQTTGKLASGAKHQFQHQHQHQHQQRRPAANWRNDQADERSSSVAATGGGLAPAASQCKAQQVQQADQAQAQVRQAQPRAQAQQAAQSGKDVSRRCSTAVAPIRCITNWQTSEGTSQSASLLPRQQQRQQQQHRHQAEQQQQLQWQVKSSSESDEGSSGNNCDCSGSSNGNSNKSAKGGGHYNAAASDDRAQAAASGERPTMSASVSGAAAAAQAAPMGEGNRNNSSGSDSVSAKAQRQLQPSASASASTPTESASFALVVAAQNIASGGHQTNIMNPTTDRNNNNNNSNSNNNSKGNNNKNIETTTDNKSNAREVCCESENIDEQLKLSTEAAAAEVLKTATAAGKATSAPAPEAPEEEAVALDEAPIASIKTSPRSQGVTEVQANMSNSDSNNQEEGDEQRLQRQICSVVIRGVDSKELPINNNNNNDDLIEAAEKVSGDQMKLDEANKNIELEEQKNKGEEEENVPVPKEEQTCKEEPQTITKTPSNKPTAVPSQPPANNRSILILREIEPNSEESAVRNIFNSENCPSKPVHCEYALHNSWYVTFKNDEDAKQALAYIRKYIVTWNGQPIMARYKPKPAVPSATNQPPPPPNLEPTMVMHHPHHHHPHPHLATGENGATPIGVHTATGATLIGSSPNQPIPISITPGATTTMATANGASAHPPSNGLIPAAYHQPPPVSNQSNPMMQPHLQHHMGGPPPHHVHHHHHQPHHHHHHHPNHNQHHHHPHQTTPTSTAAATSNTNSSSHNGHHQQHPLVPHHNHHHHHHHQHHSHHAAANNPNHHHHHHQQHQPNYGYSAVAYYGQHGPVLTPWHYSNAAYDFSEVFIYNGLTPFHHHHHQTDANTKSGNPKSTNLSQIVNGCSGVSGVVLLGGSNSTGGELAPPVYQPPHHQHPHHHNHHHQQHHHNHSHHHHQHHHNNSHHHHPSHAPSAGEGATGLVTSTSSTHHHHPANHRSHHTPTTYHR